MQPPGIGPQMGLFTINNQKFPLYEGLNTIGRNREAVVNIKHVLISQHHALITVLDGKFFISDLKSSNGSFLEGMRLVPLKMYPFNNDAKITLGNLHGTFTITSDPPLEERLVETQTQSLFDGGTQLMQSTGNVQEELTQKILWPPSVPTYVPGLQIGEIHDEPLSVLENYVELEPDPQLERVEDLPSSPVVISDNEVTDCEENPGPSGEHDANNHEATFCDKSNESLEFLNQSPTTAQPNGEESRDSSDDDSFAFKRTRKSFMVISTQDLQENASESSSHQLEETIPATQYPSALELNESDIIAATQALRPDSQSSESEFFKLGLTQLMDSSLNGITSQAAEPAPEENESIDTTHVSLTQAVQNNEDIYEVATQKVASTADETFNIFDAPTQKLRTVEDSFLQPTQPMFSEALEDVDYDSPTQKVSDDDDTFLAPTQKLSFSAAAPKENEDFFLAPTQRVLLPKRVYSFKKTKCNLDASLSVLAVGEAETGQAKLDSAATGKKTDDEVIAHPDKETFMDSPTRDISKPQDAEDVEGLQAKQDTATGVKGEDYFKTSNAVKLQAKKSESHVKIRESLNDEEIEAKPKQAPGNRETFAAGENTCSKPQLPNGSHSSVEAKSEETIDRTSMPSKRERAANSINPFIIEDAKERSDKTFKCPESSYVASDANQETVRSDCKNSQINGEIPVEANNDEPAKSGHNFASEDIEKPPKRLKRQCRIKPSVEAKSGDKPKKPTNLEEDVAAVCVEETSKEEIANPTHIDQSMALLASKMIKTRKTTKTEEIRINFPKERKSMALSVDEEEMPRSRRAAAEGKRAKTSKPNEKPPATKAAKRANKERAADEGSSSKKQRLQSEDSPRGNLRKQRHKVVFTMLNSPQLESLIKQLGGSIVDSVDSCTVLITEHVKRSQKLLEAIGRGRPICSPQWVLDSKRAKQFLDPWDYILTDAEAETNWEFSLNESLQRSMAQNLLKDYNFYIQVTNGVDVLKGGIKACGGKCLARIPSGPLQHSYVISTVENRIKHNKILQKHPHFQAIEAEAVFDAILRQEIRFSRHIIILDHSAIVHQPTCFWIWKHPVDDVKWPIRTGKLMNINMTMDPAYKKSAKVAPVN
ncbi:mediator of DNA damage checkpoint protein 1 isoform X1 [Dendroctonus ponderosae]|uniref:mediator of DNA damage checkpoint protein 1 isoform X1 n=1 Tax=Dendroctonus ponderosae TaxID=77166 RepID=UPI0020354846|nr:mediator of DNA damage checkpoint protein 1 isoform X1 [Dendroctonus ponderosae]